MHKLIILMGLPCSGKTTWAKYASYNKSNIYHIELDKLIFGPNKVYNNMSVAIKREFYLVANKVNTIILDFMCYKQSDIINVIKYLKNYNINNIEIHHWTENREKCLERNRLRKISDGFDCERSIKKSIYEIPDINILKEYYDKEIKLIIHEI